MMALPGSVLVAMLMMVLPQTLLGYVATVTSVLDLEADDGLCTLREASIAIVTGLASGSSPGECPAGGGGEDNTILFALESGSTIASNALPFVFARSVEILGPGPEHLSIANGGIGRVLVFDSISAARSFRLQGVTITGGAAIAPYEFRFDDLGGGLASIQAESLTLDTVIFRSNLAERAGGGAAIEMNSTGTATIVDSTFESNSVFSPMGGGGGGLLIVDAGTMEIRRTLFVDNEVSSSGAPGTEDPDGGGLQIGSLAAGSLLIENSTFSGNRAWGEGGAIMFGSTLAAFGPQVQTTLDSITVFGNTADLDADSSLPSGGGIDTVESDQMVTVHNSIVANNSDFSSFPTAPDLHTDALTLTSLGFNWISRRLGASAVFPSGSPNGNQDWVPTLLGLLDPALLPLADNGGKSPTHLPVTTPLSGVVDQGSCASSSAGVSDQRGFTNPDTNLRVYDEGATLDADDGCDIGAVESFLQPPSLIFADGFESGTSAAWDS